MHPAVLTTWAVWLITPGSFAAVSITCWFVPDLCTDPPNLLFACVLVMTHVLGGFATVVLSIAPGPHRRHLEFWSLFVYGVFIIGWFLIGMGSYAAYWAFVWGANATTLAVVLTVLTRRARSFFAKPRLGEGRQAR